MYRSNELVFKCCVSLLHGLPCSTSCIEPRFYTAPFKFKVKHLFIFIEKFLPLPWFEPGTFPVPSRYATTGLSSLVLYLTFLSDKSSMIVNADWWSWLQTEEVFFAELCSHQVQTRQVYNWFLFQCTGTFSILQKIFNFSVGWKQVKWGHRYLIEVVCSTGQFKSAK